MNETNLIEDLRLLSPPNYAWLAVVVAGMVVAALTVIAWKRRQRSTLQVAAPDLSLAIWQGALDELERLTQLLAPERSRDYGIASTRILRGFIERRFGIQAPRLATEEFLVEASRHPAMPSPERAGLERFLHLCDLFKFARTRADSSELRELHEAAVAFVMAAKPPIALA
jgi:hypothetical protein